jgi:transcriptional regulator NrdR family protein
MAGLVLIFQIEFNSRLNTHKYDDSRRIHCLKCYQKYSNFERFERLMSQSVTSNMGGFSVLNS